MKIKMAFVAALVSLPLTLAGCASEPSSVTDKKTGSNASKDDGAEAKKSDAPKKVENPNFGQTVEYPNGLSLTVGKPKPFKPSEYAAAEPAKAYIQFEVIVVNNTGKNVDASLIYYTMQSDDEEASEVFDSESNIEGAPSTKLLDTRQAKFSIAFGVNNPDDLVMEIQPFDDFETDSTIYVN